MAEQSHRRRYWLLLVILLPLAACLVVFLLRYFRLFTLPEDVSRILDLFLHLAEIIGVLIALIFTFQELIASKEISRANFIVGLNQSYVENEEYMQLYNFLQKEYEFHSRNPAENVESTAPDSAGKTDSLPGEKDLISKGCISNYLTFFETIYILYQRGVISFDIIDDLFAYRFFLAAHSGFVQKQKLLDQPENFKNIFMLEKEWLEYRKAIGKKDKDSPNSIYSIRLLKDELTKLENGEERYNRLIGFSDQGRQRLSSRKS